MNRNETGSANVARFVPALYGVFATAAFVFICTGVAYLVRNRARAIITAKREEKASMDLYLERKGAGDA